MKLHQKKRLALVLSGGGIKAAAFHIGVCLALKEKGFHFAGGPTDSVKSRYPEDEMTFKIYVGSSAGAVISTILAAGFSVESLIEAFERGSTSALSRFRHSREEKFYGPKLRPITYRDIFTLNGSNIFSVVPNFLKSQPLVRGGLEAFLKSGFKINGLFHTRGLENYIRKYVAPENSFANLGVQLYIIATQLNHSRKVIFGNFDQTYKIKTLKYANFATISDAVAASASLPPVFAPYGIKNQKGKMLYYFDGEIRDTLSTHVAADAGADLVIASYSIQPYHYTPEMGSLHKYGVPMIINQALYQLVQQKIEKSIEMDLQAQKIMNAVDGYFRQAGLPDQHREKLLEILADRVKYKPNVDYIYIHPSPHDHEMFFFDHFSLSPAILSKIVHVGFKSALGVLRKYDL